MKNTTDTTPRTTHDTLPRVLGAHPDMILLYVSDVARGVSFYQAIFGHPPAEKSPGFALFVLDAKFSFGLWKKDEVQPPATPPGGCEIIIHQPDKAAVDALHAHWQKLGLTIIQAPVQEEFGHTFTATDPDGHRLRVMTSA